MTASHSKRLDLSKDSLVKLFLSYFIPSLTAMLAMASYSTVDGIFINKKLGDDAMKAVVALWPLFPVVMSVSLMFALGASSLVSYYLAKKRASLACALFSSTVYLLLPLALIIGALLFIYAENLVPYFVSGLSSEIVKFCADYIRGLAPGLFSLILHPVLDLCVINDKRPRFAMIAMLVGALSNIVFNYLFLFVLETGIIGSAYATVLGHLIGSLMLLTHYAPPSFASRLENLASSKKGLLGLFFGISSLASKRRGEIYFVAALRPALVFRACRLGLPYATSEISVAFIMWLYNRTLKSLGGEEALAIYSAILYVGFVFFTILIALAESIQPIASFNYGLKNFARLKKLIRFYMGLEFCLSAGSYALFWIFQEQIAKAFLQSEILRLQSMQAMDIYLLGFIPMGANLIIAMYLQSLQRSLAALVVTLSYTLIFLAMLLPLLSSLYGLWGAYTAYPIAQLCALCVSILALRYPKAARIT